MNLSSNSFSKKTITASSNSFLDKTLSTGQALTKTPVKKGVSQWNGENLSANDYGFDDLYGGTPYGVNEYGGITHFRNRAKVDVAH